LFDAAVSVFTEKSVIDATMEDIAKVASAISSPRRWRKTRIRGAAGPARLRLLA